MARTFASRVFAAALTNCIGLDQLVLFVKYAVIWIIDETRVKYDPATVTAKIVATRRTKIDFPYIILYPSCRVFGQVWPVKN